MDSNEEEIACKAHVEAFLKEFPDLPCRDDFRKVIENFYVLLDGYPPMGRSALDHMMDYFDNLKERYSEEPLLLSKGQYIAIVGAAFLNDKQITSLASQFGLTKSNLRYGLEYNKVQTGEYASMINSPQCIAVIFGPIPHSAKKIDHGDLVSKSFYVHTKSKSNQLKFTKESLLGIFPVVINWLKDQSKDKDT